MLLNNLNPFGLSYFGIFNVLNPDLLISVTNNMKDSYDILDLLIPPQNKKIAWLPLSSLLDLPLSQIS